MQAATQQRDPRTLALRSLAAADRTQRALAALADRWTGALQPAAEALGPRLGVPREAVAIFSEEARAWSSWQAPADYAFCSHAGWFGVDQSVMRAEVQGLALCHGEVLACLAVEMRR